MTGIGQIVIVGPTSLAATLRMIGAQFKIPDLLGMKRRGTQV
jgi:hypothetical protein